MLAERLTLGQRSADRPAAFMGSWPFLLGQTLLLALWVFVNALAWASQWRFASSSSTWTPRTWRSGA